MRLVVLGLSVTSAWGNGHATTYRALLEGFARRGHEVLFLERDVPWYARHRDLAAGDLPGVEVRLYDGLEALEREHAARVAAADAVILGSYVPDGVAVGRWLADRAGGLLAFYDIDTPVTLAKLGRGDHGYVDPDLLRRFDLYLSFTGGPTLRRIEAEHGVRRARALYCSVDAARYRPPPAAGGDDGPAGLRWAVGYLGTWSQDRQPKLEALLLEPARRLGRERFAVAGPLYPEGIAWPANVERIEHVAPPDHPAFYAAQGFTLNLTRDDMAAAGWSPSVRLFEAAACGVPVLSDRWPGLDELFVPGEEIVLVEDGAEVERAVLDISDERRRAIGRAARRRVLLQHTSGARAAELERHLGEAAAAAAATTAARPRRGIPARRAAGAAPALGGS